jgi:hypothetical protein
MSTLARREYRGPFTDMKAGAAPGIRAAPVALNGTHLMIT